MHDFPAGTVTFVFTDIEGSTRLIDQLGDDYAQLLADQRMILRTIFSKHGGKEVDTQGDAFFYAFRSAREAVAAAFETQLALSAHPWPGGAEVRLRMGIHTGEPLEVTQEGYIGMDVHRAARIADVAHGGQILVSVTTQNLIRNSLPDTLSLRDLGRHRLKDLGQPEHIFQLVVHDIPQAFPALQSLDRHPNNLPIHLTSFVGRKVEIASVLELIRRSRLVAIVGPGGDGKTRLALQAAVELHHEFTQGIWYVDLGNITESSLIHDVVAASLGLRRKQGIKIETLLLDYLQGRKLLLILDSCEHLLEGVSIFCAEVLQSQAGVKIIATSRESMFVQGGVNYTLPTMSVPSSVAKASLRDLSKIDSVRLFLDRAEHSNPDFTLSEDNADDVVKICVGLDGIPLAIELAAARMRSLSTGQIASRLGDRFELLLPGDPSISPQHRTLRAVVDWSFELLEPAEKSLFRRLAVFRGGWSLEAAESICAGDDLKPYQMMDLLARLTEKSMIQVSESSGYTRYTMLETMQEYALNKLLGSDDESDAWSSHAQYFLAFSEECDAAIRSYSHPELLTKLELDKGNLNAAMTWTRREFPTENEYGLRLIVALGYFWNRHGSLKGAYIEAKRTFETAGALRETLLGGQVLTSLAWLALANGELRDAQVFFDEGREILVRLGEVGRKTLADILNYGGLIANFSGNDLHAVALFQESLSIREVIEDYRGIGQSHMNLGDYAKSQGQLDVAKDHQMKGLEAARVSGDPRLIGLLLLDQALLAEKKGDYNKALSLFREAAITGSEGMDDFLLPFVLMDYAKLAYQLKTTLQPENIVRLIAVAEVIGARWKTLHEASPEWDFTQLKDELHAELGSTAWNALWEEGALLSQDQALEMILDDH